MRWYWFGVGGPLLGIAVVVGIALGDSCAYEGSAKLPGPEERFDAIALYPAVHSYAGSDVKLTKLVARYVREDGTQDLDAEFVSGDADTYTFIGPTHEQPDLSAPIGARRAIEPFQTVEVTIHRPHWVQVTINNNDPESYKDLGMLVTRRATSGQETTADPPVCSFKLLWKAARDLDAPTHAVAEITYDHAGYVFEIDGTPFKKHFDLACNPTASDADAH